MPSRKAPAAGGGRSAVTTSKPRALWCLKSTSRRPRPGWTSTSRKLREAIKDSKLELERRDNVLAVTLPVDSSYNPDRPNMLLPMSLGPITRVAKTVEGDPKTAVLVLGHADSTSGAAAANQKLSLNAPRRFRPFSASAACSVTA